MKEALILVDYQNDFVNPQGSLYVQDAEKISLEIESLINEYKTNNHLIIATKDYHPIDHCSFQQWPKHCIIGTSGAELYHFKENIFDKIIIKGTNKNIESYSAFFDFKNNSNGLDEYLKSNHIKKITIIGVALDVCVSATLKDAIKLGYTGEIKLDYTKAIKNKIVF